MNLLICKRSSRFRKALLQHDTLIKKKTLCFDLKYTFLRLNLISQKILASPQMAKFFPHLVWSVVNTQTVFGLNTFQSESQQGTLDVKKHIFACMPLLINYNTDFPSKCYHSKYARSSSKIIPLRLPLPRQIYFGSYPGSDRAPRRHAFCCEAAFPRTHTHQ